MSMSPATMERICDSLQNEYRELLARLEAVERELQEIKKEHQNGKA
jgi:hypothetical protein